MAACTDFVDGHLARSRNLVTTFGKFMDPLVDKILVTAALVALVAMERTPAWVVVLILAREFAITGLRTVAVSERGNCSFAPWQAKNGLPDDGHCFFVALHNAVFCAGLWRDGLLCGASVDVSGPDFNPDFRLGLSGEVQGFTF